MTDIFHSLGTGILLMAQPGGQPQDGGSMIMSMLPLIVIVFIFYFMILRPQKKRQKEREALVNNMEKGDKVVTSSGIHGTVAQIEEGGTVLVQVSDNTKIRFEKSAVNAVTPKNVASS